MQKTSPLTLTHVISLFFAMFASSCVIQKYDDPYDYDCVPYCDASWNCGDDGCGGQCGIGCDSYEACIGYSVCVGTGELRFTLEWMTDADLDIMVIDPWGDVISYENVTSSSGGYLDVDSHAGCSDPGSYGVENIYWSGDAPSGTYDVYVTNYSSCDEFSTDYWLSIDNAGDYDEFTGTVSYDGEEHYVTSFTK